MSRAAPRPSARDEILGNVRTALRTARIPDEPVPPPLERAFESQPPSAWRARFIAELAKLGVTLHEEPDDTAIAARVRSIVGARRLLAWRDPALPAAVAAALRALPDGQRVDDRAPRAELAAAEVGLTAVDAVIAETGSLALVSAPDRPRTASLLPPLHVAIVRAGQIAPTFRVALARLRERFDRASALHLITGPSRTADIELQLTLGVHGPGALEVVLGP